MEAFQLRLWDGRIGRWLSPDPYGQYASPYLGMGNNPISLTDPDGGSTDCPTCPGSGTTTDPWILNEVVVYSKPKIGNDIGNFMNGFSVYGGFTFDASSSFIKEKSLIGRFDVSNATSLYGQAIQGNVYDKTLKKLGGNLAFLGTVGDIAGYYEAGEKFYNHDKLGGTISGLSNTAGILIAKKDFRKGFIWDIGWSIGEKIGEKLQTTRNYNTILPFPQDVVRKRGMLNGWWNNSDEAAYQKNLQMQELIHKTHQVTIDKMFNK
jgi:hypothetical protein